MPLDKLIDVVDDDRGFLKATARLLTAHGLRVRTFTSAEEYRAAAEPDEAACLILDIHLKGLSGIELRREQLRAGSTLPVVFVTGDGNEANRRAAFATGCVAYLEKPYPAETLLQAVSGILHPGARPFAGPAS